MFIVVTQPDGIARCSFDTLSAAKAAAKKLATQKPERFEIVGPDGQLVSRAYLTMYHRAKWHDLCGAQPTPTLTTGEKT